MHPNTPRFNEWLLAEKEASEAESQLNRLMLGAARGGCAPDAGLVQAARSKRARAHGLFDEAMLEMKTLAQSLHHRHVQTRSTSACSHPERQGAPSAWGAQR